MTASLSSLTISLSISSCCIYRVRLTITVAVIAYCFMPDHVHLLIEGIHPASECREFARIFKQRSSFAWKQTNGTALWQRSYFEHVLRDDEDTIGVAKYILENPVRANLAQRPEDYPYLGSMTMEVRHLLYSVQI